MNLTRIYAAYSKNKQTRISSSSGGVFSVLAEFVIKQGGTVWGSAYDKDMKVSHVEITDIDGIKKLRGSKYVQSEIKRDVYQKIKNNLQNDRLVLFCGTPCQTESVIKYVGKELRYKLIAIDFVCHGTPSPEVWNAYVNHLKKKGNIDSINMRNKRFGWKTYSLEVKYKNGYKFSQIFTWNHYLQLFLYNYSLRKPCYKCAFRGVHPNSDITLSDYWDIARKHPQLNDDLGISKLYVHTDSGQKLLHEISNQLNLILENEVPNYTTNFFKIERPKNRDLFFKTLKVDGFDPAYRKVVCRSIVWWIKMKLKGVIKIAVYYLNLYT